MSHCRGKEEPKAPSRLMTRSRIAPFSCPTALAKFRSCLGDQSIGESLGDIDQVKNPMKLLPLWRMKLAPEELPNIAK